MRPRSPDARSDDPRPAGGGVRRGTPRGHRHRGRPGSWLGVGPRDGFGVHERGRSAPGACAARATGARRVRAGSNPRDPAAIPATRPRIGPPRRASGATNTGASVATTSPAPRVRERAGHPCGLPFGRARDRGATVGSPPAGGHGGTWVTRDRAGWAPSPRCARPTPPARDGAVAHDGPRDPPPRRAGQASRRRCPGTDRPHGRGFRCGSDRS